MRANGLLECRALQADAYTPHFSQLESIARVTLHKKFIHLRKHMIST